MNEVYITYHTIYLQFLVAFYSTKKGKRKKEVDKLQHIEYS
jgi:hypothetical protein